MAEEDKKRIPSQSWAVKIPPVGLLRSHLLVLDIDPRPGLSFFRDGEYRFRA